MIYGSGHGYDCSFVTEKYFASFPDGLFGGDGGDGGGDDGCLACCIDILSVTVELCLPIQYPHKDNHRHP